MSTIIITRHPGAVEWLRWAHPDLTTGDVQVIAHMSDDDVATLTANDVVIGVLPLALAAKVCAIAGSVVGLDLPHLPAHLRGKELTAAEMMFCGARLTEYTVSARPLAQTRARTIIDQA